MSSKNEEFNASNVHYTPGAAAEQDGLRDADDAYRFLRSVHVDDRDIANVNLARLRRKIDMRIVPFLLLAYTAAWLDKSILNVCT